MKIISPRSSLSLDYTPKQWVGFMNTCLLVFVTFMFGLVVYNMRSIDQQLIRVLDSSVVAIDLLTTDLLHSQTNPYWRTVGQDMSVYSAFYKDRGDGRGAVMIVGSSPSTESTEDLRCLLEYEDEDDINIAFVDYRRISNCSHTIFLFCHAKTGAVPKKVALVSYSNNVPNQWMEVRTIRTDLNRTDAEDGTPKMSVCVRPLQGGESVKDIAEFVAFYETVGADHIYFYDRNARQDVVDFILELEGMGHSVNHLSWNRNDDPSTTNCSVLWSEHVQDCVHRSMDKYNDVVTVELSDFVVPTEYFRLPTMLEQIRLSHQNVSQLRLKSANFCEDHSTSLNINLINFGKMTVRGELEPSDSNFFIHLDPELILGFRDQTSDVILPGSNVSVHRHSKRCDTLGSLDYSAFKYSHIIEQSNVLKLYRRTSKGIENQATSSPV